MSVLRETPLPELRDVVARARSVEDLEAVVAECLRRRSIPAFALAWNAKLRTLELAAPTPAPASPPSGGARKRGTPAKVGREENQRVRSDNFRASLSAQDAAEHEVGRGRFGEPIWAAVPGYAHRVRVPAEVALYVTMDGKRQKGERERIVPAPRFWPGGAFPAGYEDLGEHVPPIPQRPQPGSAAWMARNRKDAQELDEVWNRNRSHRKAA